VARRRDVNDHQPMRWLRRRCPGVNSPVGARTEKAAVSTSRSAVPRRFVAQNETALAELLAPDLSGLDLVALMVDAPAHPSAPA
jgi:hypothetical protein